MFYSKKLIFAQEIKCISKVSLCNYQMIYCVGKLLIAEDDIVAKTYDAKETKKTHLKQSINSPFKPY